MRRRVVSLLYDTVGGSAIYSQKSPFDRHMRDMQTACQHMVAQTKGWEAEKYLHEGPEAFGVEQTAREAAGDSSPLSAEHTQNRARWSFLDDLETGHHFDMEKLVVYFLKLQILDRKDLFNKERGTEKFEKLIEERMSPRGLNGQAA